MGVVVIKYPITVHVDDIGAILLLDNTSAPPPKITYTNIAISFGTMLSTEQ